MAFVDLNLDLHNERYEGESKALEIKHKETKVTANIKKLIAS